MSFVPQIAVNAEAEAAPARADVIAVNFDDRDDRKDHFIEQDGMVFAGSHLFVDSWDAAHLDDIDVIEDTLHEAIEAAGATLLHMHLHPFEPNGVSGVAVLAESHISIHTWPERGYAARDVFMCGDAEPMRAVDVLRKRCTPSRIDVGEHRRGGCSEPAE